jgi:hypothetical protein
MITALILLAQLHCAPTASGNVDCYDVQKGGAPVLKVEPNLFGGFDLRDSDGKVVRCEKKASGETECRVVQEGRRK